MRVLVVRVVAAVAAVVPLTFLAGCGGGAKADTKVAYIHLTPTTVSLNEGGVATLSATAQNASGATIPADITFTSSAPTIATVSTGGLVCGGVWDTNIINCASQGAAGVGQATITATSGSIMATTTVYVHLRVDRVDAVLPSGCTSMSQIINITGKAYNTSAPGCSPAAPCDISSTVGPFTFGSNDTLVAASSSGINPTYSPVTNTPIYISGGSISGSKGQTCSLSSFFGVTGAMGTVTLTGANTIAAGTHLDITASGYAATLKPTQATLANGTATCSGTAVVATDTTPGSFSGQAPGATSVFASVSGVNSVAVPYETCRVVSILVHGTGGSDTSFTLNPTDAQPLTAEAFDSTGTSITPTVSWGSSSTAIAKVTTAASANTANALAVAGGTASVTASCTSPYCNRNVPTEYSQNVVTIHVTQPAATTVYAGSTHSKMLVPISTSNNTPGTPISLPDYPNSILASSSGTVVYLGTATGIIAVNVGNGTTTTAPVRGALLAVAPVTGSILVSDSANNAIHYFNALTGMLSSTKAGFTPYSSAYTPDGRFNGWIDSANFGYGTATDFSGSVPLMNVPSALDIIAQGGFTFITSKPAANIQLFSNCDKSLAQTLSGTNPTLVRAIPNGTGAVAADSPSIDVVSTPATLGVGCPITTPATINAYDLGAGTFNARQLLVSPDSSNAWLISDLPSVIGFNLTSLAPSTINLTGGATGLTGGLTADGAHLWVGASDNTVHRIDLSSGSGTDAASVPVNLKDSSGNVTAPDLIVVVP